MKISESRLISLLKTFDKEEWKKFGDFVAKESSGTSSKEYEFFRLIDKRHPQLTDDVLDRMTLVRGLFGKGEKDDLKLRRVMSKVLRLAERFVVTLDHAQDPISAEFIELGQYSKRNLPKHFEALGKKLEQKLAATPIDLEWHHSVYKLAHTSEQFAEKIQGRRQETTLQSVSNNLDNYFMVSKLKQACAMLSYQRVFNQEYDLGLLNPVLDHLAKKPSDQPLVKAYHTSVLLLLSEEDTDLFSNLMKHLEKDLSKVALREAQDLHVMAQNHCIRQINKGNSHFVRSLFNLYRMGLGQEVIQTDPAQFAPAFKNIVSVSMKLGEYDWAEQFIYENSPKLGERFEKDYLRYNLAQLNFAQGKFLECRSYIHAEEFDDPFIKLNVRILLLKTYYELDQIDNLNNLLDSFKQFLHRNSALSYHKKNSENLLSYTRRLANLAPGDSKRKERLVEAVKTQDNLAEKRWLLAKLAALK